MSFIISIMSFQPFGEVPIQSVEAQLAGLQSFSGLDWSNGERCYLQDYAKKAKKQYMFGMVTKPVTVSAVVATSVAKSPSVRSELVLFKKT